MMEVATEAKRLKQVREDLGLTQSEFGHLLGMSTTYDIERGKTRLSGELVCKLMKDYHINPLWLYGESMQKHIDLSHKETVPSVITVESTGFENILMVNQKAAAGYAGNLGSQEFFENLPAFSFPSSEYRNATFRCFQVDGYSMTPAIQPDEWIIAEAVENISQIKNNDIYIIVDKESIRIKQIKNDPTKGVLHLISLNQEYAIDQVRYDDVMEIWAFHSKITREISLDNPADKLDEIYHDLKMIKAQMIEKKEG